MKKIFYVALLGVVALATSCVSQHNVNRAYTPLKPDVVRLNVTMADYEYLGEVTMEVVYKRYGLVKKVLTINGENYDPRYYTQTQIDFTKRIKMSKWMKRACHKIVDTYPTADYIVPVSSRTEFEHMMGGKNIKETMTVKVFALKNHAIKNNTQEIEAIKAQLKAENQKVEAENAQLKTLLQKAQEELAENERKAVQFGNLQTLLQQAQKELELQKSINAAGSKETKR